MGAAKEDSREKTPEINLYLMYIYILAGIVQTLALVHGFLMKSVAFTCVNGVTSCCETELLMAKVKK